MNSVLIIGAGLSSSALIRYTLQQARKNNWRVTIADVNLEKAQAKANGHPNALAVWLDVTKVNDRRDLISRVDVVVSLLPAHLHLEVAHDCIKLKKHLITASYVSHELYRLGDEARNRELIFMGEMGLDPGIDHMSAMQVIDRLKAKGAQLQRFHSYTGGLIAPESDDNPWHYKFTWNPRNVVLAGQGTAQFLENEKLRCIPYHRLFKEFKVVDIPELGEWEVYANRDSLLYREVYGLNNIPSIFRGTIRHKGFCKAWDALIQLGFTDGDFPILASESVSYHELLSAFLPSTEGGSLKDRTARFLGVPVNSAIIKKLDWLGLFRKSKIRLPHATPALILQDLLEKKWAMKPFDKDMVLMVHEFEYLLEGRLKKLVTTLKITGENAGDTAMAKTVGLPMGIFVKLVMENRINSRGVHIPVLPEVYNPVLEELESYGIAFKEYEFDEI